MTALVVSGNSGLPDDAFPFRFKQGPVPISVFSFSKAFNQMHAVLLGGDLTMTGAAGIGPCFASMALGGVIFYWDSQSTGEGQGITFAWRGQLPLGHGDVITWAAQQPASDLSVSCVMWGYFLPRIIETDSG